MPPGLPSSPAGPEKPSSRAGTSSAASGESDDGEEDNEEVTDFDDNVTGNVTPTLTATFGFKDGKNATGDPNALNSFSGVIELELQQAFELCEDDGATQDGTCEGDTFDGYVFSLSEFTTTYDPIGAAPLTFSFGEEAEASFTNYVFDV